MAFLKFLFLEHAFLLPLPLNLTHNDLKNVIPETRLLMHFGTSIVSYEALLPAEGEMYVLLSRS